VIIITGASDGIGEELAKQLSVHKPILVLAARTVSKLEELKITCENTGAKEVFVVATDVSVRAQCQNLIMKTIEKFGKIDIFIFECRNSTI